ncbi:MAG: hypothetical protein QM762_11075 [Chryseolinea sp.]
MKPQSRIISILYLVLVVIVLPCAWLTIQAVDYAIHPDGKKSNHHAVSSTANDSINDHRLILH